MLPRLPWLLIERSPCSEVGRSPRGTSRGVDRQEDSYLFCVYLFYAALGREGSASLLPTRRTSPTPPLTTTSISSWRSSHLRTSKCPWSVLTGIAPDHGSCCSSLCWRFSDPEETLHENRALLVSVRLTEVEGFTD